MAGAHTKIVECVPNFSEGRRSDVIEAIADAIRKTDGCSLLDVDPGASTNRTVYTFVGSPEAVVEGALRAARVARDLIDMQNHKGEHPRIGALDVCPYIPVSNVTMEECVECSRKFGQGLAELLNVPVFLYEKSATRDYRRTLPQIRAGEYEGLEKKLKNPDWSPDYGPAQFVPGWGATVTGARTFLIAYNVNLLSTKQQAHRIALDLRQQGRGPEQPGKLKEVKAIGWYLEEKDMAQVSMNLTDFEVTPLHVAYEECCREAQALNLAVVGSEVVGLLPLKAVLMVAEHYIARENLFVLHDHHRIRLAVERLGLSSLAEFKPQEKIIEYCIGSGKDGPLLSGSVRHFVDSLCGRTPTPGGGSASACIASMAAALGTMVGMLTYGKRQFESLDSIMRPTISALHSVVQGLLPLVDQDAHAYEQYMDARGLPKKTMEEKQRRSEAIDKGVKAAINVPMEILVIGCRCWPHLITLAQHGNPNALSDLQVAARALEAGLFGAHCNVLINLPDLSDKKEALQLQEKADAILEEAGQQCKQVLKAVSQRREKLDSSQKEAPS